MRFQDLLCKNDARRQRLRDENTLHGLDYLEVRTTPLADNQRVLELHFIAKSKPAGGADLHAMLGDLHHHEEKFALSGGTRIPNVRVTAADRVGDIMVLRVSEPGDFSMYTLAVDHPRLDPVFSKIEFSFKAGCPSQFDCGPADTCAPEETAGPAIDYMAKDYASFRQALLDRLTLLNPDWRERSAGDLGMVVAELLAYAADHLSYYQDAVANEAYLETARQRISVRRHARLIDYRMSDGASARAFVRVEVSSAGVLREGTQVLTRITGPLRGKLPPHGYVIAPADADAAVAAADAVFEIERDTRVYPQLTGLSIHTWGRAECCLPRGATTADLETDLTGILEPGDLLLFEEVKSRAGKAADADPARRQVVRLTAVQKIADPLLAETLTRVRWDAADALAFPFCLSAVDEKGTAVEGITVARGNVAAAHAGRRFQEAHTVAEVDERRHYAVRLGEGPLSQWRQSSGTEPVTQWGGNPPRAKVDIEGWRAVDSLLDSDLNDRHFVVEVDNQGRGVVRFGDGAAGRKPANGDVLSITYRTGVGPAGNVARDAVAHIVNRGGQADWPVIDKITNPLPAEGGEEPESLEHVKLTAPASLRLGLYRAVTEADYAQAAEMLPEVSKAVAAFRWTGFWHTVFLTIDPAGGGDLAPETQARIEAWVRRFLQAGYDLKIQPPVYVPLDVAISVCVDAQHFRSDAGQALRAELGTGVLPGGRKGFFHPDNFTFGQPVYLSQLYARVLAVGGVRSAEVKRFQRFGKSAMGELAAGILKAGRTEIIRLDNDPNFAERGRLELSLEGGK